MAHKIETISKKKQCLKLEAEINHHSILMSQVTIVNHIRGLLELPGQAKNLLDFSGKSREI
jgi:hypothetical protein